MANIYEPREAEKDYLYHKSVMYGFFIVMISVVIGLNHVAGIRYGLIKSNPVLAAGVITAVEDNAAGYRTIIFRFEDRAGRDRAGFLTLGQMFDGDVHAVGKPIDVEYFGLDSTLFFPKQQLDMEHGVFLAFLASLGALGLLIWRFWKTFTSIRSFKEQSRRY